MTLMSRYKGHSGDAQKKTFFQIKNDLNGSNDIREMILCSGCQQLPKWSPGGLNADLDWDIQKRLSAQWTANASHQPREMQCNAYHEKALLDAGYEMKAWCTLMSCSWSCLCSTVCAGLNCTWHCIGVNWNALEIALHRNYHMSHIMLGGIQKFALEDPRVLC